MFHSSSLHVKCPWAGYSIPNCLQSILEGHSRSLMLACLLMCVWNHFSVVLLLLFCFMTIKPRRHLSFPCRKLKISVVLEGVDFRPTASFLVVTLLVQNDVKPDSLWMVIMILLTKTVCIFFSDTLLRH